LSMQSCNSVSPTNIQHLSVFNRQALSSMLSVTRSHMPLITAMTSPAGISTSSSIPRIAETVNPEGEESEKDSAVAEVLISEIVFTIVAAEGRQAAPSFVSNARSASQAAANSASLTGVESSSRALHIGSPIAGSAGLSSVHPWYTGIFSCRMFAQSGVAGINSNQEPAVETAFKPVDAREKACCCSSSTGFGDGSSEGWTRMIEFEQWTCRREKVCVGVQRTAWFSDPRGPVVFGGVGAAFILSLGANVSLGMERSGVE